MGIDQSFTGCGVVILDNEGNLVDTKLFVTNSKQSPFQRSWSLLEQISELAVKYQTKHVALEGLAFAMKGNATRSLAILQGILVANLQYQKTFNDQPNPIKTVEVITPLSLKKQATGKGKADKTAMISSIAPEIVEEWKKTFPSGQINNLADAYHLARVLRVSNIPLTEGAEP